jgi:hypothetical protein
MPCFDDAGGALEGRNLMLVQGGPVSGRVPRTRGDQEAGMDAVASSTGSAIAGDRSGAGALVMVVGGALQHQAAGAAAMAQLAGPILVVVLGGWPVRVLPAGGSLSTRLVVDEPGLAVDGGRPLLSEGDPARRAGPGSAGRRRAAEEAGPSAVGVPSQAAAPTVSQNLFRREGEYWTVAYEGSVVRLRDAKGLGHLARLLAHPGREFHVVELEAANHQPGYPPAVGPGGRAGAGELQVRPDLGDAGALLDATAKAAYRARLAELGAELDQAEAQQRPRPGRPGPGRAGVAGGRAGPGGGAGGSGPAGGRPCRAGPGECDQGDPGGGGQPGPGPSWPGPAPGRDRADGPVLCLHPRPAGPDRLAALTGWVLRAPRGERPCTRGGPSLRRCGSRAEEA